MKQNKSAFERVLEEWAKDYRSNYFTSEVSKAVQLANYDLHFGPACQSDCAEPPTDEYGNENEWSGFSFDKACIAIKEACEDIPHKIWIDIQGECWQDDEPQNEECPECNDGIICNDEGDEIKCSNCNGEGVLEPMWKDYYEVERRQLIVALVGKELTHYV